MKAKDIPFIPDGKEVNEELLKKQESVFLKVLDELMNKAKEYEVTIRAIGSLAFRIKCPDYKYVEYKNNRYLTDIDFIAYSKEIVAVQDLFFDLGWTENQSVLRLFGDKRRIFYHPEENLHSDIFINKLRFCHEINFKKRLEIDYPTISLVDLLLEKLQIVEINKKDLVDMMVLLSQYPVSQNKNNNQTTHIDGFYLAKICSKDWGWWKTATTNLTKTKDFTKQYLDKKDAGKVTERINVLFNLIDTANKSLKWKARSIVGEKVKWYREVEEVERE